MPEVAKTMNQKLEDAAREKGALGPGLLSVVYHNGRYFYLSGEGKYYDASNPMEASKSIETYLKVDLAAVRARNEARSKAGMTK